jgi:hypothetical protein
MVVAGDQGLFGGPIALKSHDSASFNAFLFTTD